MSCKLEPAIWPCDIGQWIPCFDRCQLIVVLMSDIKEVHSKPKLHVSVNLFWSMAAMLRDSVAASVVVVIVRTHPWAIPLAMITMRKSTLGFPFLSHDEYGAPLGGPSGCRSSANIPFVLLLGPCRERAVLSFTWKFATRHLDQKFCVHCSCFCGLSDVDLAGRFPALPCKS